MNQAQTLKRVFVLGLVFLAYGCAHRPAVTIDPTIPYRAEIINLNRGLQRLSKEAKGVEAERDVLAGKIKAYLALNCLCKHKAVLK